MKFYEDQHTNSLTRDGSATVYSQKFDQHFHNQGGAVAESRHVFFETPGLPASLVSNSPLNIAETGFGSGLNLLLLCEYHRKLQSAARVNFYSVEAYPISFETASGLNYHSLLKDPEHLPDPAEWFRLLNSGWNAVPVNEDITLHLYIGTFENWELPPGSIDFFLHDPFSVDTNPEGWSHAFFSRLCRAAKPDALLTTYASATRARAAMAAAGWTVAKAPGALGKRDMSIASPDSNLLKGFKLTNTERLRQRYFDEFVEK